MVIIKTNLYSPKFLASGQALLLIGNIIWEVYGAHRLAKPRVCKVGVEYKSIALSPILLLILLLSSSWLESKIEEKGELFKGNKINLCRGDLVSANRFSAFLNHMEWLFSDRDEKKLRETEIEKKNLEAHVELCAERYNKLETQIDTLDEKITEINELLYNILLFWR
jgi:hypothetical protein